MVLRHFPTTTLEHLERPNVPDQKVACLPAQSQEGRGDASRGQVEDVHHLSSLETFGVFVCNKVFVRLRRAALSSELTFDP